MKIEAVDFFYLSMPVVTDAGDGSQDALVVRLRAGGLEAWGECEASPLTSIASFVCPMSHGACRPVGAAVLGARLDGPADIAAIADRIARESMDLLQAAHTWSGVEMALWDLLGRARGAPVWSLLGYRRSEPKLPYASVLFGDTPAETLARGRRAVAEGFGAAKFGWGPIGRGTVAADADQFAAAREGVGPEALLMVDAGQVFGEDVEAAAARLPALADARATWFEEPFAGHAYEAYAALAARSPAVALAGGEAAHTLAMARHLMAYGGVRYIQIDTGRIGGIGPARAVAELAAARGVTFVNHTFTTHLALSASLQPYAGLADHRICEFPGAPSALAQAMVRAPIPRAADGTIRAPEAPGLGVEVDAAALRPWLVQTEITVGDRVLYRTPELA
jgi:L-alanine-DL-glutamate epimerase-like enolase superfamily enzyme